MSQILIGQLSVHPATVAVFAGILTFYLAGNSLLQKMYYTRRKAESADWKNQPARDEWVGEPVASSVWWPWRSADARPGRHPYHFAIASFNTLMVACVAGYVAETTMRGTNKLFLSFPEGMSPASIALDLLRTFVLSVLFESVVEYYWHRAMHSPLLYARMHKLHHYYKSPAPFDDMMIHPLEAFGYYCILYGPAFVIPQHASSFLLYMGLMGVTGITDHSGIQMRLPWIYDTKDHDVHHELFNVNFGFPFIALDLLHGTYRGEFAGKWYSGGLGGAPAAAAVAGESEKKRKRQR
jgi:sterol desaturase/sphingolipid hydroxylase (fatty acid hydroxylase superfamily)